MNTVPWLRSGVGKTPAEGGCIMQVIDWIHSEGWSDQPTCVHPVLRRLAIKVNDLLDDGARQKLLDLAPRLIGTASPDRELNVDLAIWCARRVLHIYEEQHPDDDRPRKAIEAAERRDANAAAYAANAANAAAYAANAANAAADAAHAAAHAANAAAYAAISAAAYAAYAAAYAADAAAYATISAAASDVWGLLLRCLDEYDRLTGRGEVAEIEEAQWTAVCGVMV